MTAETQPAGVVAQPYRLVVGDWREDPRTIHGPDGHLVGGLEPDDARRLCDLLNRLSATPARQEPEGGAVARLGEIAAAVEFGPGNGISFREEGAVTLAADIRTILAALSPHPAPALSVDLEELKRLAERISRATSDHRYPRFSDMEAAFDAIFCLVSELERGGGR